MKIAVNTRLLIKGKLDGIGWFTFETMKRIVKNHPEHDFYFMFDRPFDKDFVFADNVHPVLVHPPSRHPILWWMYFGFTLPMALRSIKPDVFLSLDGYLPAQKEVPMLDVIHDINFEHYPKMMPWLVRKYYQYFFPQFARLASRIATVSEFSKSDIVANYDVQESKIDVVYNGVNPAFKPISEEEKAAVRNKYSGGVPFVLFVGTLHQRKNIVNMLLAFDLAKEKLKQPIKFIVAGKKMWWTKEMQAVMNKMKYKDAVHFTGRVDPQVELIALTAAAEVILYVPFFEGFGVPVLEAQSCGVPVITSNTSSLPEVAGDAALLCPPSDPTAISAALIEVLQNSLLRQQLIVKGHKNVERFSWDRTAKLLWDSILKLVHEKT